MTLRKYLKVAAMHCELRMVYRVNAILETSGNLLTMLVTLALWLFAFHRVGGESIGGYTESQMVSYLIIAGLITSTLWHTSQGDSIISAIRHGRISKYFVKPISLTVNNFIAQTVDHLLRFAWSILAIFVFLFAFGIPIPYAVDLSQIPLFCLFFILAIGIQYLVFYNAALLAFWMEEVWGITFTIRVLADIAAGAFIPLALFAPFWQRVFDFLPFKYIISIPVNTLLGRVPAHEVLPALLGSVVWLIVFAILTKITWVRGVRHYSAVGG